MRPERRLRFVTNPELTRKLTAGAFAGLQVALPADPDFDASARVIQDLGGVAHRFLIAAEEPRALPIEGWVARLSRGEFGAVIFPSAQSVRILFDLSRQFEHEDELIAALWAVRRIAIGPKTVAALNECGLKAVQVGQQIDAEQLASLCEIAISAVGIASTAPDGALLSNLESAGIAACFLASSPDCDAIVDRVLAGRLHVLILGAPADVQRLSSIAQKTGVLSAWSSALGRFRVWAVGHDTERALLEHHVRVDAVLNRLMLLSAPHTLLLQAVQASQTATGR